MSKEVQTSKLQAHYEKWKRSGVTQVEYCKRAGISYLEFKNRNHRQRRKSREQGALTKSGQFNAVSMVEKVKSESPKPYCEIVFAGEHKVSFSDQASLIGLKTLIRDLIKQ
jgi:hypothetical protein